ncbi:MAG: LysR family transcriptional regulator [Lachnospiraceae bacterium]|nr:LysR family transcriptional regulator [Lachnospiraceae bacterium]
MNKDIENERMSDEPLFRVKTKLILQNREDFFGPGMSRLLHLIDEHGSIAAAAKEMEMAYSKAWKMLRKAEKGVAFPLILREKGGKTGGGSKLTKEGKEFIELYDEMQVELKNYCEDLLKKYMDNYL